jgi:hypothetical protein
MSARGHIFPRQVNEPIRLLTPRLEESRRARIIAALGHLDELAANGVHLTNVASHEKRNIGGQIPHIVRREVFQHADFPQALWQCIAASLIGPALRMTQ